MRSIYLTSSLVNYKKVSGKRIACEMNNDNNMVSILKDICTNENILLVASNPYDYKNNDVMKEIVEDSFNMSNVLHNSIIFLDNRNVLEIDKLINNSKIIILMGGHLPTQNKWFNQINLKEKLLNYDGTIIGQSAGSMNMADNVYSCPEYVDDLELPRYLNGLGLTTINIFPHYDKFKDVILGEYKMIDDIVLKDSFNNCIYGLNDGSFIKIDDDVKIYGECFLIKDGNITKIGAEGNVIKI